MNSGVLEQAKLDVVAKHRSNLFGWRGQFTPQFVEHLLDVFAPPDGLVADPFCGSGTVLLEAAARGLPAIGCELNPAAFAMSRFVALCNLPLVERKGLFRQVEDSLQDLAGVYDDLPLFVPDRPYRERYADLLELATAILGRLPSGPERVVALVALMRAENSPDGELGLAWRRACQSVRDDLYALPFSESCVRVILGDARRIHEQCPELVATMVTSPPYINVFNYHQNHRALLEVLGFDLLRVAASEIGANRKNRGNRFRTVVQYALDMEQCLASFARCLRPEGTLVLVIGHESNVRGVPFGNAAILTDIAAALQCFRFEGERSRVFVNRFGKSIREDILVLRNHGVTAVPGSARRIAERHLLGALDQARGEVHDDILSALADLATITASPLAVEKEAF